MNKNTRTNLMLSMYVKEGKTLEMIGRSFGVTRERVRQLITVFPEYHKVTKNNIEKPAAVKICITCLRPYKCPYPNSKNCSMKCRRKSHPKLSVAEKRAKWNEHTKNYYHTVLKFRPDFKRKSRERNRRDALRRKLLQK